ncbi:MAG: GTP-binding protein [Chitinophagaceae bacterium]
MKLHLLSGFLGSGKTTAIQQACAILMQQGTRVGVITNDQGIKLVDSKFFKNLDIPGRQVINGCFCCNYNELNNNIESLIEENHPDIIFAESVGTCTDIVATVMKPLLNYRSDTEVTVSTFADARLLYMLLIGNSGSFDSSVTYIYFKQLEEAGIIIVNKVDLMNKEDLSILTSRMNEQYGHKKVIFQNSLDATSFAQWLQALNESSMTNKLSSLDIDYTIYGAGEAKLAWLDQELEILSTAHSASKNAADLVNLIYQKIAANHYSIGHLKFLLNEKTKISFTSTTRNEIKIDGEDHPSSSATLLINARVQTEPDILSILVLKAIEEIKIRSGCTILVNSLSAFQPGFPKPTYRIAD